MKLRPEEITSHRGGTHGSPTRPLLHRCDSPFAREGSRRAKPGSARQSEFRRVTGYDHPEVCL